MAIKRKQRYVPVEPITPPEEPLSPVDTAMRRAEIAEEAAEFAVMEDIWSGMAFTRPAELAAQAAVIRAELAVAKACGERTRALEVMTIEAERVAIEAAKEAGGDA